MRKIFIWALLIAAVLLLALVIILAVLASQTTPVTKSVPGPAITKTATPVPAPAVTETVPGPTVTKTVTRTVTKPGPVVTRTVVVPGPVVTVTAGTGSGTGAGGLLSNCIHRG